MIDKDHFNKLIQKHSKPGATSLNNTDVDFLNIDQAAAFLDELLNVPTVDTNVVQAGGVNTSPGLRWLRELDNTCREFSGRVPEEYTFAHTQQDGWIPELRFFDSKGIIGRVALNDLEVKTTSFKTVIGNITFPTLDQIHEKTLNDSFGHKPENTLDKALTPYQIRQMLRLTNSPGIAVRLDSEHLQKHHHRFWKFRSSLLALLRPRTLLNDRELFGNLLYPNERFLDLRAYGRGYLGTAYVTEAENKSLTVVGMDKSVHADLTLEVMKCCDIPPKEQPTPPKEQPKMQENHTPANNFALWNTKHEVLNEPLVLVNGFGTMFANTFMKHLDSVDDVHAAAQRIESIFAVAINAAVRHGGWRESLLSQNDFYYEMFANAEGVILNVKHGANLKEVFSVFFLADSSYYNLQLPARVGVEDLESVVFSQDPLNKDGETHLTQVVSLAEFHYLMAGQQPAEGDNTIDQINELMGYAWNVANIEWDDVLAPVLVAMQGPSNITSPDKNVVVQSDWAMLTFMNGAGPLQTLATGFVRVSDRENVHKVARATGRGVQQIVNMTYKAILEKIRSLPGQEGFEYSDIHAQAIQEEAGDAAQALADVLADAGVTVGQALGLDEPTQGPAEKLMDHISKTVAGEQVARSGLQVTPVTLTNVPPTASSIYSDEPISQETVPGDTGEDESKEIRDRLIANKLSATVSDYVSFEALMNIAAMYVLPGRQKAFERFHAYVGEMTCLESDGHVKFFFDIGEVTRDGDNTPSAYLTVHVMKKDEFVMSFDQVVPLI